MKQPLDISLEGAIDLHVHPAPCLFQRPYDDVEVARMCAAVGMKAILLKSHYEYSMSRAYYATNCVPQIQVFGGVVLNRYVGGLNPLAVEYALRMGAKEIWMPDFDSAAHAEVYGSVGTYEKKGQVSSFKPAKSSVQMVSGKGLSILHDGEIRQEVRDIVKLVIEYDAILGSCHLSKKEIYELAKYVKSEGGTKLLITHPYFKPPDFQLEELKPLVDLGATLEFCASLAFPPSLGTTAEKEARTIRAYGTKNCVIASDAGAAAFPAPHETLRVYAQWLFENGISREELRTMMVENPKRLVNLA